MLVSTQIGTVESTYKPGLGEEVYDTVNEIFYRGNGYDTVASLSTVGGPVEITEVIIQGNDIPFTADAPGNGFGVPAQFFDPDDATADITVMAAIPTTWNHMKIEFFFILGLGSAGNARFFTDTTVIDSTNDVIESVIQTTTAHALPLTGGDTMLWSTQAASIDLHAGSAELVDSVAIQITRTSAHGSDTFDGSVDLVKIKLSKVD